MDGEPIFKAMPVSTHFLSKKDTKELLGKVLKLYPNAADILLKRREKWKLIRFKGGIAYAIEEKTLFLEIDGNLIPTFYALQSYDFKLPKVVVDEGAVPHILNGADVLRPGIREVQGSFEVNDVVVVVEEKHGVPIAVGNALIPSSAAINVKRGKVVKVLHHIGDPVWRALNASTLKTCSG